MAIKGCKSIAEYAFRRWMQEHLFAEGYFTLEIIGSDGTIRDRNGDTLELHYDDIGKCVEVRE